jgi:pimeloyl-ACP methyl ester carboxylesterase
MWAKEGKKMTFVSKFTKFNLIVVLGVLAGFQAFSLSNSALAASPDQLAAGGPEVNSLEVAKNFRNIFLGSVSSAYSEDQRKKLIYLPNDAILHVADNARSPEEFLAMMNATQKATSPIELYELGAATPSAAYAPDQIEKILLSAGKATEDRVTVIAMPGIFAEFIKNRVFGEVLDLPKSAYRDLWEKKLAAYKASHPANDPALSDMIYSTEEVGMVSAPIEDFFHVSSIDTADGTPLVNLLVADVKFMSLESVGKLVDRADEISRRAEKFFHIMGEHKNIALLGYSQGGVHALEMLAQGKANPNQYPWLKNVRAMIAMGGVSYGSDLADLAMNSNHANPAPKTAIELEALKTLSATLETTAGKPNAEVIVKKNFAAWGSFISTLIYQSTPARGSIWDILKGLVPGSSGTALAELKKQLASYFTVDMDMGAQIIADFGFKAFDLNHPVKDYDKNITRFKNFADAMLIASYDLSTEARLAWWKTHTVPSQGITYYGMTTTMVENTGSPEQLAIATNRTCYNPDLLDYNMLMGNYVDFKNGSGLAVNDSQMSPYKVRFSNELNALLNSQQEKLNTTYLGILGTHHWGMAFKSITRNPQQPDAPSNPFPRPALLKALATQVAQDLELAPSAE